MYWKKVSKRTEQNAMMKDLSSLTSNTADFDSTSVTFVEVDATLIDELMWEIKSQ